MSSLPNILFQGLGRLRQGNSYCDFTIVADEKEFACHRVVLAAVSPFFETMFNSGMHEAQTGRTEVDFSAEAMELFLQYIYENKEDILTADTVPELYYAANFFGVTPLIDLCDRYMKSGMREDISLEIWQYAKLFGKLEIAEIAKTTSLKNFKSFENPWAVGRVSLQTITDILAEPYLNCTGKQKCKVAWIWLLAQDSVDQEKTSGLVAALVKSLNVESDDILQTCDVNSDVAVNEGFEAELVESRKQLWMSATETHWIRPGGGGQSQAVARIMPENESSEWVLILGGTLKDESKMTLFNFKEKKWFYIEAAQIDLGHHYAISAIGSVLYLSGGAGDRQKQFKYFDIWHKRWEKMQELPVGREQHSMVTVRDAMYIIGGNSNDRDHIGEISRWQTKTGRWERCGEMANPVAKASSAVVGTKVFIVGGSLVQNGKVDRAFTDMVQCFETGTGYSYRLRLPLPFKSNFNVTSIAAVNGNVYILHKGAFYQVDETDKAFKVYTLPNGPVKGCSTVAFGDKILVIGGEDDDFMQCKDLIQYDPVNNTHAKLPIQTPFEMTNFRWTKIRVPTTWDLKPAKQKNDIK